MCEGILRCEINRINLIPNKPLLELSSVVNSTAPTEETAARIRLVTMTFFRPNLKFKIKPTCALSWRDVFKDNNSVETNYIQVKT